jgi:uncharacterized alkaline shock family protein YloU
MLYYPIVIGWTENRKESLSMVRIENDKGTITITSDVFTNIAGDAATNCFGVKGMAGRSRESGLVQLLRRDSMSKGVFISFDNGGSISIELHIVVDHGVNLNALCKSIISEVSYKVSSATGVPVKRVDVYVDSMIID